jgi:hypothetical protein
MSTVTGNLTRIRRFLRDPEGLVWTDDDILQAWNMAQLEITQKAKFLERVEAHHYPPEWTWSYQWDWEKQHIEGDMHKCLLVYQQTGEVITYPWEAGYWMDANDTPDDGYRCTHPWETAMCSTPSDIVPMKLHTRLQRMKFCAYDEEPIQAIQPREVATNDPYWKTRTGQVTNYCIFDETENLYFLYPHPSAITWHEVAEEDTFDDSGGLITDFGTLYESDTGLTTDIVDTEDSVFMVYDAIPYDLQAWEDDCLIPDVFLKYVEYATLERCFGADTDAFIPTLRDYWKMRKDAGIEAMKRMLRMRVKDRDYQFGGIQSAVRRRGGSLGPHYPSV